jgi:hypothetical protein
MARLVFDLGKIEPEFLAAWGIVRPESGGPIFEALSYALSEEGRRRLTPNRGPAPLEVDLPLDTASPEELAALLSALTSLSGQDPDRGGLLEALGARGWHFAAAFCVLLTVTLTDALSDAIALGVGPLARH